MSNAVTEAPSVAPHAVQEANPFDARSLDYMDRQLINQLQRGMPICSHPYANVAHTMGLSEPQLLLRLQRLLTIGILSRFGPMFQIERAGGRFTLAAMAVPPERFDEIAAQVNAFPEVAHNYQRTHTLNMWFVLGTETPAQCADAIKRIEQTTGLPVLDMPKLREFRVQLFFDARLDNADIVAGAGWPTTATVKTTVSSAVAAMDNLDRAIMRATQAGLPLHSQPFADVATQVGATEAEVIERFEHWQSNGILRRIAAVPNHYALGYVHNGMTVWNVDDESADALGEKIAALGFVSHCYRRPRHLPGWPYNVFAMVHGRSREQTDQQIKRIADVLGNACRAHDVLWSTRILKKTGLRISE